MAHAYSGSTLLAFLLGSHSDIATVGELGGKTNYNNYSCSCGQLLNECQFWNDVQNAMVSKGYDLQLDQFNIRPNDGVSYSSLDFFYNRYFPFKMIDDCRDKLFLTKKRRYWQNQIIQKNVALAETICEVQNKNIFFDSTKDFYRLRYLKDYFGGNLKILRLCRNGKAIVHSMNQKKNYSIKSAIKEWIYVENYIERIIRNYVDDKNIMYVYLEELCNQPIDTLNDIFEFLSINKISSIDNSTFSNQHLIGNVMRKNFDGTIRLNEEWKSQISTENINIFNKYAKNLNEYLGYD